MTPVFQRHYSLPHCLFDGDNRPSSLSPMPHRLMTPIIATTLMLMPFGFRHPPSRQFDLKYAASNGRRGDLAETE